MHWLKKWHYKNRKRITTFYVYYWFFWKIYGIETSN